MNFADNAWIYIDAYILSGRRLSLSTSCVQCTNPSSIQVHPLRLNTISYLLGFGNTNKKIKKVNESSKIDVTYSPSKMDARRSCECCMDRCYNRYVPRTLLEIRGTEPVGALTELPWNLSSDFQFQRSGKGCVCFVILSHTLNVRRTVRDGVS